MPAHIYVRLGRYPDAVRVNEEAIAAQARQKAALDAQGFSQSFDWDGHNRDFLWFAALTEGRGELALAQARALAVRAAKGKNPTAEFLRGLPLLTRIRTGGKRRLPCQIGWLFARTGSSTGGTPPLNHAGHSATCVKRCGCLVPAAKVKI